MKRMVLLSVTVFVFLLMFTSCGNEVSGNQVSMEGKWTSVYFEGAKGKYKADGVLELEIKQKDGGLTSSFVGDEEEGKWRKEGDKYIISYYSEDSGETVDAAEAIMEGNVLKYKMLLPDLNTGYMCFTKDIKNFKYPKDVQEFMPIP